MKLKIYITCTILLLTIFILNIIWINKNKYFNLNPNINLNGFISELDYENLKSSIEDEYSIEENIWNFSKDILYEKRLLSYSKEVTEKLFDSNISVSDMLNKYFIREPFKIFGFFENNYTADYSTYLEKYDYFRELKSMIISENITYEDINDIKLYYSFLNYYVVQVYLNNTSKFGNLILQYNIVSEESSGMLKVNDIFYFKQDYLDECYDNNSIIKRFDFGNKDSNISDDKVLEIYNKYKESIVKINVYNNDKIVDEATGFFINDDIVVTTFDIFTNSIFEKYTYEVETLSGEKSLYKGMISFSKYYNIAVIKIDKKIGKRVEINYNSQEFKGDNVIVPSITGNVYVGTFNETIDIITINSNLLLNSIDKGSIILNSSGDIIGINTRINPKTNVLLSVNRSVLSNVYNNTEGNSDDISAFKLNSNIRD